MEESIGPHCKALASPNPWNFALSICILFGILLSYLPQHHRIISRRSSFGISPYFILLGTTSGTFSFSNILVLPRSGEDIACCKEIDGFSCFAGLLGIFQVGVQALCFAIILFLFVIFYPRSTPSIVKQSSSGTHSFRIAILVAGICILQTIATAIVAIVIVVAYPNKRQFYANLFGIFAAILSSIQYFPQIYTTFRLRRVGSLSIPMMCIQTPGSLVWAASLAARLGTEGWSTWGVYVVTALLQGTLLIMGIYFEYINPSKAETDVSPADTSGTDDGTNGVVAHRGNEENHPSEETPLLQSTG
ncbi:PQ loop repeat protein [Histoplasma capsulatum var. duboisii H88]|uniref:PQ loop repeat protein n=1 Tax=Ajellomyces capsulatus (strain H88) TaxID=544711 RepID=A0A8A1LL96_AJEC8|nr:PQ loop repeat protein [Histoplasma capsulatum var. duboisii H88]